MKLLAMSLLLALSACGRQQVSTPDPMSSGPANEVVIASGADESDGIIPAPDFELPQLGGTTYSLAERRGKVVIVNFWATWCGPCVRETPAFVALQKEWADRPFEIVGISEDEEGLEVVAPFVEEYGVPYPMVADDGEVADLFGGVYAMPSSFVIDQKGHIVHRIIGEFPFEEMRPKLEALLAGS